MITIFNSKGQEVIHVNPNFRTEITVDVLTIGNGVYICILNNGTSLQAKKFSINK